LTNLFAPINNYYGNLVIIQHDFLLPDGLPVFTLYGHMRQVVAGMGQAVAEGDVIGVVGATGIALGPHLHFEVRVGSPFDFNATRNPEMWLRPYPGFGLLAGRVTDTEGNLAYGVALDIQSNRIARKVYTYGDDSVNPDSTYGENFAIGDLPAGNYIVSVTQGGRLRFQQHVLLLPDQLTWLEVSLPP
jgi:murein DD-endopeptidase MepM/ murein hydrolase activator NlpD